MPSACRLNDICTGHQCYPPRKNMEASEDVFINNRGAHRVGDKWKKHRCSKSKHHGWLYDGSSSVYINNKKAGRIGDPIRGGKCSSHVMTGSPDVFIGD